MILYYKHCCPTHISDYKANKKYLIILECPHHAIRFIKIDGIEMDECAKA